MSSWYLDSGLVTLSKQIEKRHGDCTIYTIGDESHSSKASDHNPDPDGSVDAIDVMIAKAFGKDDAEWLFDSLTKGKDKRLAYVIYNKRIVSSSLVPWSVRAYSGKDPHTDHVHVSINDKYPNNISLWRLEGESRGKKVLHKPMIALDPYTFPKLTYGMSDDDFEGYRMVCRAQNLMNITADGEYGPATAEALKKKMKGGTGRTIGEQEWIVLAGLSTRSAG
jgi:hypothetical protein